MWNWRKFGKKLKNAYEPHENNMLPIMYHVIILGTFKDRFVLIVGMNLIKYEKNSELEK